LPGDTPTTVGSRILFPEVLVLKYSCVRCPSTLRRTNSRKKLICVTYVCAAPRDSGTELKKALRLLFVSLYIKTGHNLCCLVGLCNLKRTLIDQIRVKVCIARIANSLLNGRYGFRSLARKKFSNPPPPHQNGPILMYNGYGSFFKSAKQLECTVEYQFSSSAEEPNRFFNPLNTKLNPICMHY
jgi:hypothetical protein